MKPIVLESVEHIMLAVQPPPPKNVQLECGGTELQIPAPGAVLAVMDNIGTRSSKCVSLPLKLLSNAIGVLII